MLELGFGGYRQSKIAVRWWFSQSRVGRVLEHCIVFVIMWEMVKLFVTILSKDEI